MRIVKVEPSGPVLQEHPSGSYFGIEAFIAVCRADAIVGCRLAESLEQVFLRCLIITAQGESADVVYGFQNS